MLSYDWMKLHHDILDDPKMGRLPDRAWRRCLELFLLASSDTGERDGTLPTTADIAWQLRIPEPELSEDLILLEGEGILFQQEDGHWFIVNFAKRQARTDPAERKRRYLERQKKLGGSSFYSSLPKTAGVYLLRCTATDGVYIGASQNIQKRIRAHLSSMMLPGHALSEAVQEHGIETIQADVLELTDDPSELAALESYWQEQFSNVYNRGIAAQHGAWAAPPVAGDNGDETGSSEGGTGRSTDTDPEAEAEQIESRTEAEAESAGQAAPAVAAVSPPVSASPGDSRAILEGIGVRPPALGVLASSDLVTPELIYAWQAEIKTWEVSADVAIGSLINQLKAGIPPPTARGDGNGDRGEYIPSEYADLIQH